ncbi:hypothetical protein DB30_06758 [Enhygromyxa salina]|uniref:SPOR domain-containing protein n=1 Tax=Enhygromyxa salina TaxID=215803 RepID=A0A0C2CXP7_9BACT|nr:SPOR domain-containing protein [Enhygromyxa salina]KIG14415.1 hypothetical protein DB30_06758 [Enhygromyxa salina]
MLSQISLVVLSWFSSFDPAAGELIDLIQRVAVTDVFEAPAIQGLSAVQIELLPDRDSADALAADLQRRLGDELSVFVEAVGGEGELPPSFRIGVGPFDEFEQAERAQLTLAQLGFDGFVRQLAVVVGC